VKRATGAADLKLAAAPISWGVCEVPGWGHQMSARRVLAEARALGFQAIESGPQGYLRGEPEGLRILGGFIAADRLRTLDAQARRLKAVGAEVLVMAAAAGHEGYEDRAEPDPQTWRAIARVQEICHAQNLGFAVHPHFGTRIETAAHLHRLLSVTTAQVCLDTGHLLLGGADPLAIPPERVGLVHLKDVDGRLAEQVRERRLGYLAAVRQGLYRPLGEGDGDIRRIVRRLRDGGYQGWFVLEQDVVLESEPAPGQGPLEDVRRSLEFARAL